MTVVEYGDFQCPYCAQAEPVMRALLQDGAGQVRLVFRHFPIPEIHDEALPAAYLAELAGEHGQFWAAHDLLFEHQDELGDDLYARICDALGLDFSDFEQAIAQRRYAERIESDEEGGIRSGVNGTPTFFVDGQRVDDGVTGVERRVAQLLG